MLLFVIISVFPVPPSRHCYAAVCIVKIEMRYRDSTHPSLPCRFFPSLLIQFIQPAKIGQLFNISKIYPSRVRGSRHSFRPVVISGSKVIILKTNHNDIRLFVKTGQTISLGQRKRQFDTRIGYGRWFQMDKDAMLCGIACVEMPSASFGRKMKKHVLQPYFLYNVTGPTNPMGCSSCLRTHRCAMALSFCLAR